MIEDPEQDTPKLALGFKKSPTRITPMAIIKTSEVLKDE